MSRRAWGAGAAGLALVLPGCTDGGGADPAPPAADTSAAPVPVLPDGWRWESYRDVEVGVPGDWPYSGSGRISQWCAQGVPHVPAFGRPAAESAVRCWDGKGDIDPGSLLANGGTYVVVVPAGYEVRPGGDRIMVIPDAVSQVVIQAESTLRDRIAATVHRITEVDHNGCAVHRPIAEHPAWRPSPVNVGTLTGIEALRACRYTSLLPAADAGPTVSLFSSLRIEGDAARRAVAAVAAAPKGGGPDRPSSCTGGYGDEAVVVQVLRAGAVLGEFVIRYSGCDHHGFDDGVAVRTLTAEAITPFLAPPNSPRGFGREMEPILRPAISAAQAAAARE